MLGLWLLVAPWMFAATWVVILNSSITGLLLIAFSGVRGQMDPQQFGGGWSALWRATPPS